MSLIDGLVLGITEEDVQLIAEEKLNRRLTKDEMETFSHKFEIPDWADEVELSLEILFKDKLCQQ
jgi:hypothetical protein